MADGKTVHRLDRRATAQGNPDLLFGPFVITRGVTPTDEIVVNVEEDLQHIEKRNYLEVEIQLEGKGDLSPRC